MRSTMLVGMIVGICYALVDYVILSDCTSVTVTGTCGDAVFDARLGIFRPVLLACMHVRL